MKINSRLELAEHCLRRLGKPVIAIEIADEQISDIIDDVLQLYIERVYDGTQEYFLRYRITQTNIDAASTLVPDAIGSPFSSCNNFIILPDYVTSVTEVLSMNYTGSGDMFGRSAEFFAMESLLYNNNSVGFDIVGVELFKEYLGAIDYLLKPEIRCRFNLNNHRLYIDQNIHNMLGNYIVIRCSKYIDADQFTDVLNSRFVKDLATIRFKLTWGQNLSKFSDVSLVGGIKYNADKIYNDAKNELELFMNTMQMQFETPATMLVG